MKDTNLLSLHFMPKLKLNYFQIHEYRSIYQYKIILKYIIFLYEVSLLESLYYDQLKILMKLFEFFVKINQFTLN